MRPSTRRVLEVPRCEFRESASSSASTLHPPRAHYLDERGGERRAGSPRLLRPEQSSTALRLRLPLRLTLLPEKPAAEPAGRGLLRLAKEPAALLLLLLLLRLARRGRAEQAAGRRWCRGGWCWCSEREGGLARCWYGRARAEEASSRCGRRSRGRGRAEEGGGGGFRGGAEEASCGCGGGWCGSKERGCRCRGRGLLSGRRSSERERPAGTTRARQWGLTRCCSEPDRAHGAPDVLPKSDMLVMRTTTLPRRSRENGQVVLLSPALFRRARSCKPVVQMQQDGWRAGIQQRVQYNERDESLLAARSTARSSPTASFQTRSTRERTPA